MHLPIIRTLRAASISTLVAVIPLIACSPSEGTPAVAPPATATSAGSAPEDPLVARADSARIRGNADATVWLLEVSDYQCPFCKQWHDEVYPTVIRDYVETGKVRLAYVNFPLDMHPNAPVAAEATMCAGAQSAELYWKVHDLVFNTQEEWAPLAPARPFMDSLATSAGVDADAFASCMDSHLMLPLIEADAARMQNAGVRSTPTFFVGNTRIEGAQPLDAFRRALDAALAGASGAGTN